ncbi:MAG: hypothetical protein JW741_26775, partial [Sedimentisphaerales bacterium]|nr:hypothetical protein [Sedimentisphaerales bacterium]
KVESARHMKYMSEFFHAIAWWTLEPRHDLVLGQPDDWMQRMALAKSASGDLAVAYLPDNAEITVNMQAFPAPMRARWFNPITGEYHTVPDVIAVTDRHTFARPSGWQDALLLLEATTIP